MLILLNLWKWYLIKTTLWCLLCWNNLRRYLRHIVLRKIWKFDLRFSWICLFWLELFLISLLVWLHLVKNSHLMVLLKVLLVLSLLLIELLFDLLLAHIMHYLLQFWWKLRWINVTLLIDRMILNLTLSQLILILESKLILRWLWHTLSHRLLIRNLIYHISCLVLLIHHMVLLLFQLFLFESS